MPEHLHISGDVPEGINVEKICKDVFDKLIHDSDVIADLSLPQPEATNKSFEENINKVKFIFVRSSVEDIRQLPTSYTSPNLQSGAEFYSVATIYYADHELDSHEVIIARLLHEATHALRYVVICLCDNTMVSDDKLEIPTPAKDPKTMSYKRATEEPFLYKMERAQFHAGHYLEHKLLGGVWVTLTGWVLDKNDQPVVLPKHGKIFKLVAQHGEKKHWTNGTVMEYTGLLGAGQDGVEETIYHFGARLTGTDDEDQCRR